MTNIEERQKYILKTLYDNLCYHFNGDVNKRSQGIVSPSLVAEFLRVSEKEATEVLNKMVEYRITEKQGGGYVV